MADAEDNDVEGQEGCVGEHEQEGGGSGVNKNVVKLVKKNDLRMTLLMLQTNLET